MPIFKDKKRISFIKFQGKDINQIFYQNKTLWKKGFSFSTSTWSEIKRKINDGSWIDQGWDIGDTHSLRLKDGQVMQVRIIGINDGRENKENFLNQIDKDSFGNKVHLTLELTKCLKDSVTLFDQNVENNSQTYSESLLYPRLQPNGDLFENLPDDLKDLIIPVVKYSGITGYDKSSEPKESLNYLFLLSILEYVGSNNYEINEKEGMIYEFYSQFPQYVQRKIEGGNENTYFWTRSASQVLDGIKEYFWSIASYNNYAMYPSNTTLPISYAFCI